MFKVGDLVTCSNESRYLYTKPGVICEVCKEHPNPFYIYVKVIKTNGIISDIYINDIYRVEAKNFGLIDKKKNNIDEWR